MSSSTSTATRTHGDLDTPRQGDAAGDAQRDLLWRDYRVTSALKSLVDRVSGSSLIVVHHTQKADTSDFLEAVSGTNGIAGAADTILVLKRDREASSAILQVTSRDGREGSTG